MNPVVRATVIACATDVLEVAASLYESTAYEEHDWGVVDMTCRLLGIPVGGRSATIDAIEALKAPHLVTEPEWKHQSIIENFVDSVVLTSEGERA